MTVLADPQHRNGVQPLLSGLAFTPRERAAARPRRLVKVAGWLRGNADRVRTVTLTLVGLGAPTTAAFEWHGWAGLVALGVSALLLDVAVERGKKGGGDVPSR